MKLDTDAAKFRDYVVRIRARAREANIYLEKGDAPTVVSAAQEAFELLWKALCLVIGTKPPRTHELNPKANKPLVERLLATVPANLNSIDGRYCDMQTFLMNESPMILAELQDALGPAQDVINEMVEASKSTVIFGLTNPIDRAYLQRLLFLADLWAHFYTKAKYGYGALGAPPSLLVTPREASLAVDHLTEADALIYRLQMKLVETARDAVASAASPSGVP